MTPAQKKALRSLLSASEDVLMSVDFHRRHGIEGKLYRALRGVAEKFGYTLLDADGTQPCWTAQIDWRKELLP